MTKNVKEKIDQEIERSVKRDGRPRKEIQVIDCYHPMTGEVIGQRKKVKTILDDDGMTKQSDKSKADIRNILKNHARGVYDGMRDREPLSGELPNADSFFDAMQKVTDATQAFEQLPVDIRQKFENDPAKMLDYVHNDENYDEAVKMGLIEKPEPVPEPQKVEVVNPVPPEEPPPKE